MPPTAAEGPILLFDGECNLCAASVRFVIARDPARRVRFASLQSEFARHRPGLSAEGDPESLVLLEGDRVRFRSTAVLRLCGYLGGAWPLLRVFLLVPGPLRDLAYRWIARNRYRWFGRRDACWLPGPESEGRFVE